MPKKVVKTHIGTVRIKTNGQIVEKTKTGWKKSKKQFPEAQKVIKLFKAQRNIKALIDSNNPQFFKGQITRGGLIQGARIPFLPDGKQIDTAYSLFAKHLQIHGQDSEDHWDVLFQNKGGTWNYAYTLEKKQQHKKRKYKLIEQFDKNYKKLTRNVTRALKDKDDNLAVPMYTLLKTYMRIGNEIYYKANKHKGLTTIKKQDIKIKNNEVTFNYIGKDSVPRLINKKFPSTYVKRLKQIIRRIKKGQFVFTSEKTGKPLKEQQFKKAFLRYCGHEFYPHIVRSHYATKQVQSLIKNKRKISKEEMNHAFLAIASKLGHKKFVKKEKVWKDNYNVTINFYVKPELVEKIKSMVK